MAFSKEPFYQSARSGAKTPQLLQPQLVGTSKIIIIIILFLNADEYFLIKKTKQTNKKKTNRVPAGQIQAEFWKGLEATSGFFSWWKALEPVGRVQS